MAEVMASCEKCGAFVQAANVTPDGLVAMNPEPTAKHWEDSPGCRGAYGLVNIQSLKAAADMAASVLTSRKEARRLLEGGVLRRLQRWIVGPWYRRQMRRYLDRMDEQA